MVQREQVGIVGKVDEDKSPRHVEVQVVKQREGYPILERPRADGEDAIDDKGRPRCGQLGRGGTVEERVRDGRSR